MLGSGLLLAATMMGTPARIAPGDRYVSLGSSYAAGPGVGRPDAASGGCARSLSNYAQRVAADRRLALTDAACSGATTANILDHGQHGFPAQIAAVTPETRLVTVLIGGNDIDYVGNLLGLSCRATGGTDCRVVGQAADAQRLAALPAALDRVVAAIRARAPGARIVLVGYLPVLPATGAPRCTALPLALADGARMRGVAIRLAQAIGSAAARNGTGLVQATLVGAGADACAARPFVAGYHPAVTPGWPAPVPYHPTQAGMDRIATAVEAVLDGPAGR